MSQKVFINKASVKRLISEFYGLPVNSINEVRGVYKVMTEAGIYAFKNAEELPDLTLIRNYVEHIRNSGFDRLPRIMLTISGNELIEHEGYFYYLEQWAEAKETIKKTDCLEEIGLSLADFHRAARGLVPPFDSDRYGWGKRPDILRQCMERLHRWRSDGRRGIYAGQMLDFLEYRCRLAYSYLNGISYPNLLRQVQDSAVLCHGSLHHKNILLDNDHNIWFIDLESLIYAERTYDLAGLLHYFAPSREWDLSVVSNIINSYQSRLEAPLIKEEWKCMLSYLAFPRRMHNSMLQYFDKTEKEEKAYFKLKKVIAADWSKEKIFMQLRPNSM